MLLLEFTKVHPILEIKQIFTSALESNWENKQGNCEQHGMLPVVTKLTPRHKVLPSIVHHFVCLP